jgi:hypothetical protein
VKEYLAWRVEEGAIDWFELFEQRCVLMAQNDKGIIRSKVFPGSWLDVPAMLQGDLAAVFAGVDAGTATEEHAEFKRRLASATA